MKVRVYDERFKGTVGLSRCIPTWTCRGWAGRPSLVPIVRNLREESGFAAVNLQILTYTVLKSLIRIADPAAIKASTLGPSYYMPFDPTLWDITTYRSSPRFDIGY